MRQKDVYDELNIPYVLQPIAWLSRVVYKFFVSPWLAVLCIWIWETLRDPGYIVLYGCCVIDILSPWYLYSLRREGLAMEPHL